MAETPPNYYAVRDRETLVRLASGVEIMRARKHEPISFADRTRDEIKSLTNKENGSKFATDWNLERYVEWLTAFVELVGWSFPPSLKCRAKVPFQATIGIAAGIESHTN